MPGRLDLRVQALLFSHILRQLSRAYPHLPLRLVYALAGDVEVFGLDLYADEFAAEIHAGNACGAGAHEGVEDVLTVCF